MRVTVDDSVFCVIPIVVFCEVLNKSFCYYFMHDWISILGRNLCYLGRSRVGKNLCFGSFEQRNFLTVKNFREWRAISWVYSEDLWLNLCLLSLGSKSSSWWVPKLEKLRIIWNWVYTVFFTNFMRQAIFLWKLLLATYKVEFFYSTLSFQNIIK